MFSFPLFSVAPFSLVPLVYSLEYLAIPLEYSIFQYKRISPYELTIWYTVVPTPTAYNLLSLAFDPSIQSLNRSQSELIFICCTKSVIYSDLIYELYLHISLQMSLNRDHQKQFILFRLSTESWLLLRKK